MEICIPAKNVAIIWVAAATSRNILHMIRTCFLRLQNKRRQPRRELERERKMDEQWEDLPTSHYFLSLSFSLYSSQWLAFCVCGAERESSFRSLASSFDETMTVLRQSKCAPYMDSLKEREKRETNWRRSNAKIKSNWNGREAADGWRALDEVIATWCSRTPKVAGKQPLLYWRWICF